MNIIDALVHLRDDLKTWVTNNLLVVEEAIKNKKDFSGKYSDLTDAPNITNNSDDELLITDNDGNAIFQVNEDGINTTEVKMKKLSNESDELLITDNDGNAIFQVNEDGINTTEVKARKFNTDSNDLIITDSDGNTILSVDKDGVKTTEATLKKLTDSSSEFIITDSSGNTIFTVNVNGIHTTSLSLNGETLEEFRGLGSEEGAKAGLVPAPSLIGQYLSASGDWAEVWAQEVYDADRGVQLAETLDELYNLPHLTEEQIQTMIDESIANIAIYEGEAEDIPLTITFSIEGTNYTADRGMTWAEWIESDYNTAGITTYSTDKLSSSVVATYVVNSDGIILNAKTNQYVTDTIVANTNYTPVGRYSFAVDNFNYTAEAGLTWYEWVNSGDTGSGLFTCDSESSYVNSGELVVYLGDGTGLVSSALVVYGRSTIIPYGLYNTAEEIVDGGM